MNKGTKRAIALLLMVVLWGVSAPSFARKTSLKEGPVIRNKALIHTNRFMIDAAFGGTLADSYKRNFFVLANLEYHINEMFAVGADFAYGILHTQTSLMDNILAAGQVGDEQPDISDRLSTLNMLIGAHFTYMPIQGKFALFSSWVLSFDIHLMAGVAAVQLGGAEERYIPPDEEVVEGEEPDTSVGGGAGFTAAPMIGIGQRLFFTKWFALSLTFRDYIVWQNPTGLAEGGKVQNNFLLSAGLAFFLPPKVKYGN